MPVKSVIMNEDAFGRALTRMAHEIVEKNKGELKDLAFIGIRTRGVPLAERLSAEIKKITGKSAPIGILDITLYRDDLGTMEVKPEVKESKIKFSVADKTIILVDDVLYTGRTVRAALDAIAEMGRPKQVLLAVLIDRGHRELPIKADFVGKNIPTSPDEIVSVYMKETDGDDSVKVHSL